MCLAARRRSGGGPYSASPPPPRATPAAQLPTLLNAVWGAQNQVYRQRLAATLAGAGACWGAQRAAATRRARALHPGLRPQLTSSALHLPACSLAGPVLSVPVFSNTPFVGDQGAVTKVLIPGLPTLQRFNTLELDFTLGCPGTHDADCPLWDHVVQLFVCCPNPDGTPQHCDTCQRTAWRRRALLAHETPHWDLAAGRGLPQQFVAQAVAPACGRELGRWITPFKRRNGRWLTDATPLAALLTPGHKCTFTLQSAPWAGTWTGTLNLRFSSSRAGGGTGDSPGGDWHPLAGTGINPRAMLPSPSEVLALPYAGGEFNSSYNWRYPTFSFATPPGLRRALLYAVISGGRHRGRWGQWAVESMPWGAWAACPPGQGSGMHRECRIGARCKTPLATPAWNSCS